MTQEVRRHDKDDAMARDVFISYRHSRKVEVEVFCRRLDRAGITYFRDEERRDDVASIQRGVDSALAQCKVLLAWFDLTYLASRACRWELDRAMLAARAGQAPWWQRIVCVNPTPDDGFAHIVPEILRDECLRLDDPERLVSTISERVLQVHAPLGAISVPTPAPWYERPAPRERLSWIGRDADLGRLFGMLCQGEQAIFGDVRAGVAITGHGGEGKTMLAEQYALRFAAAYPAGVVWLEGGDPFGDEAPDPDASLARLETGLLRIARGRLGLEADGIADRRLIPDREQRTRHLRDRIEQALWGGRVRAGSAPYLWIVDDLPRDDEHGHQALWLPGDPGVHCIVTMRHSATLGALRVLAIPALSEVDALAILTRWRPATTSSERRAAAEIVERLGRLPLALDLAASIVRIETYHEFLALLTRPLPAGVEVLAGKLTAALPTRHVRSIVRTFDRSLAQLRGATELPISDGGAAWLLLRTAALLAPLALPDDFARRLLRAAGVVDVVIVMTGALLLLDGAGLIESRTADDEASTCIAVHVLLARTVVETRIDQSQRDALFSWLTAAAGAWLSEEELKRPAGFDHRLIDIMVPLASVGDSPAFANLLHALGAFAYQSGRIEDAQQLLRRCLALRQEHLGPDDAATVDTMDLLGVATLQIGDVIGAVQHLRRAVALRLRKHATNGDVCRDERALSTFTNLADALHAHGDQAEARQIREWTAGCLMQMPLESRLTLGALHNLALTMACAGQTEEARALHEAVLRARVQALPPDDPDVLESKQSVALISDDFDAARRLQAQVLRATRRTHGDEHPLTLSAVHHLAILLRAAGRPRLALRLLSLEVKVRRRRWGERNPHTLSAMNEWAVTLAETGVRGQARSTLQAVLAARRALLGDTHPNTLGTMAALARMGAGSGDPATS